MLLRIFKLYLDPVRDRLSRLNIEYFFLLRNKDRLVPIKPQPPVIKIFLFMLKNYDMNSSIFKLFKNKF
jgi:hypothetical protein